jgi:hypothetical protein
MAMLHPLLAPLLRRGEPSNFQKSLFLKVEDENRFCKSRVHPRKRGYSGGGEPAGKAFFHSQVSEIFVSVIFLAQYGFQSVQFILV